MIDDESVVADTLGFVLNLSGFEAVAAYSGAHALELAQHIPCDHQVTDVMMEHMNGIEAAIRIRAALPNCTVLLLSVDARTAELLDEAANQGHLFEILAKPVHPTEVLSHLQGARPQSCA